MKNRTLVIGDIHGGLKALQQVLERSKFNHQKDQLICLGDYVDGWSQSSEVIELLLGIKSLTSNYNPAIFIRGNHDKWCEDWLISGQTPLIWTQQGGQSTIDSYIRTSYLVKDSHRDFFKSLVNYHVDENNVGFVHGGFKSKKGLGHEVYQSDYYWDRDLWELAMSNNSVYQKNKLIPVDSNNFSFRPHPSRMLKHKEVYIGHTSTINWKAVGHYKEFSDPNQAKNGQITVPMNRCNIWNMDTGGGFKGKVSIMDIDTKEYWQSDLLTDLYPEENGR